MGSKKQKGGGRKSRAQLYQDALVEASDLRDRVRMLEKDLANCRQGAEKIARDVRWQGDQLAALRGQIEALQGCNRALEEARDSASASAIAAERRRQDAEREAIRAGVSREGIIKAMKAVVEAL